MSITFVSAGAGSGKTYKLTEIIREAILNNIAPENIIATTFTIKAASEIRKKVHSKFLEKKDIDNANKTNAVLIGTINSVCGTLLSQYAFDAELSPNLEVLDADRSQDALKKIILATVSNADIIKMEEIEKHFSHSFPDKNPWHSVVAEIVQKSRSYQIDPSALPEMGVKNAKEMCSCLGASFGDPDTLDHALIDILEEVLPALLIESNKTGAPKTVKDYYDLCLECSREIGTYKDTWNNRLNLCSETSPKGCKDSWNKIQEALLDWQKHPRFHTDILDYTTLIFSAASVVSAKYAEYKKLNGWIDFTDQEVLLYTLLDKPDVVSRMKERLSVLLVDEFQDTSPIQLALFYKLALIAQKTYWIGDIKQAIYGFRGSDSSLVEAVIKNLEDTGNIPEVLEYSWRSVPALVEVCNEVFPSIFEKYIPAERVVLKPKRPATGSTSFMHWELSGNKTEQWKQIAAGIEKLVATKYQVSNSKYDEPLHTRAVSWNDIAVLLPSNDDIKDFCAACREAGIPLRTSGKGLLSTPEAVLITACLKRLADVHDTLSSAEILSLTEGLSPENWLSERLQWRQEREAKDDGLWRTEGEKANRLLSVLEDIRPNVNYLSLSALLDLILMRGEIEKVCMGWSASEGKARERLVNIQAYRDLVFVYEQTNATHAGLGNLVLALKEKTDENDERPASPVPGVWVETWHSAKGLEWPVCLCFLNKNERDYSACGTVRGISASPINVENLLGSSSLQFWPWPFGQKSKIGPIDFDAGPGMSEILQRCKNEAHRLLYVGFTRAKDLLILPLFLQRDGISTNPPLVEIPDSANELLFTPHCGETFIRLGNGNKVPYEYWSLTPLVKDYEENVTDRTQKKCVHWFPSGTAKEFLPAILTPSDHAADFNGGEAISIGAVDLYTKIIPRGIQIPIDQMGTAYHDSFAFMSLNGNHRDAEKMLCDRFNDAVLGTQVSASITQSLALLRAKWPACLLHTELSVTVPSLSGTGQIINARVDLLVETEAGFYIVDHKLTEKKIANTKDFASKYASQLSLYQQAIEAFGGKSVLGLYLNIPQEGMLVEILFEH